MADTSAQRAIADWVTRTWISERFGEAFYRGTVRLTPGGERSFAAVNADGRKVGTVCTSGGTNASGKLVKVRADLYFLLLTDADHRFVAFVDPEMHALALREQREGRVPPEVEMIYVPELPEDLQTRLLRARAAAAAEASPNARLIELDEDEDL